MPKYHCIIALGALTLATSSWAQSFDVASVRISDQPYLQIAPQRIGGRITWTTDLWHLIGYAYHLPTDRLSGPIPGSVSIITVDATMNPDTTDDQVRQMFQSLLIERFGLQTHRATKEQDGFILTAAKGGIKAKEVAPGAPRTASGFEGRVVLTLPSRGIVQAKGLNVTLAQLAEGLGRPLRTAIWDQTGLTSTYDFDFRFATDDASSETDVPSVFAALKDLGLKLEKGKGTVEILIVDHVDKTPSAN